MCYGGIVFNKQTQNPELMPQHPDTEKQTKHYTMRAKQGFVFSTLQGTDYGSRNLELALLWNLSDLIHFNAPGRKLLQHKL